MPNKWIKLLVTVNESTIRFQADDIEIFKGKTSLSDSGLGGVILKNSDIHEEIYLHDLFVV